jgi:hypothetical protein
LQPPSVEPARANRIDERALHGCWGEIVSEAEGVGPGPEREHGSLLHSHRRAHRAHLERVRHHQAREAQVTAETPLENLAIQRRRGFAELRHTNVRRHDAADSGVDRSPKRQQRALEAFRHCGELFM